jgi:integrase
MKRRGRPEGIPCGFHWAVEARRPAVQKEWVAIFPAARLNVLTPTALEGARAQLTEGRTPQTVNRYMGFLRRVLNKAVRDGKLTSNPVSRIKMFRESAGKTRFLSPAEEQTLCAALGAVHARWGPVGDSERHASDGAVFLALGARSPGTRRLNLAHDEGGWGAVCSTQRRSADPIARVR